MCRALRISPVELEGPDAARLERNPAAMYVRSSIGIDRMMLR